MFLSFVFYLGSFSLFVFLASSIPIFYSIFYSIFSYLSSKKFFSKKLTKEVYFYEKNKIKRITVSALLYLKESCFRRDKIKLHKIASNVDSNIAIQKAKTFIENGNYENAEKILIYAMSKDENNYDIQFVLGEVYLFCGKIKKAEIIFKNIFKENRNSTVLENIGICRYHFGNLDETIKIFNKVIKMGRKHSMLLFRLSKALFKTGNRNEAISRIEEGILINKISKENLYIVANIYERFNEKEKAKDIYKRIARLYPLEKDNLYLSGRIKTKNKR